MDLHPSVPQQELIDLAHTLALDTLAPRAAQSDRDARAAALMRPWTQDIATQQAWEYALGIGVAAPPAS